MCMHKVLRMLLEGVLWPNVAIRLELIGNLLMHIECSHLTV